MSELAKQEGILDTRNQLRKNALGFWGIVFFVIATNAPLTTVIGAVPVIFILGNGVGAAGTYFVVGLMYLLFSIGFTAMGKNIQNAGAYYSYIIRGLGNPLGVGGAFVAITSYFCMQLATYAMFGFFANQALKQYFGLDVSWWINCLILIGIVHLCGIRKIDFSGKLLGIFILVEIAAIIVIDLFVVFTGGGPAGFSAAPFIPGNVFTTGFGAALIFVIASFIGFETTAIYSEEVRNPKRTVPRATYTAVFIIMIFFSLSVWALEAAYGYGKVVDAANADLGNLVFNLTDTLISPIMTDILNVMMLTSLFACVLSYHNSISRYGFSLGRERLFWNKLGKTHAVHQTPYVAAIFQTVIAAGAIIFCTLLGADPMGNVLPLASSITAIGVVTIQACTSLAVIGYFLKNKNEEGIVHRLIAPGLSIISLLVCLYFIITNLPLLTGQDILVVNLFPVYVIGIGILGVIYALWIRKNRPEIYNNLDNILNKS